MLIMTDEEIDKHIIDAHIHLVASREATRGLVEMDGISHAVESIAESNLVIVEYLRRIEYWSGRS